eukprot:73357-Prorocentrum_minimum.AAC.8
MGCMTSAVRTGGFVRGWLCGSGWDPKRRKHSIQLQAARPPDRMPAKRGLRWIYKGAPGAIRLVRGEAAEGRSVGEGSVVRGGGGA